MKSVARMTLTAAAVSMALGLAVTASAASPQLKTQKDKNSYMVGMSMAGNIPEPVAEELDPAVVSQAVNDILSGKKPALSPDEAKTIGKSFSEKMKAKMQAVEKKAAAENKAEGDAFLAKNRKASGVHVTASGLQYKVDKKGDGPKPKASDTVQVNYKGSLLDGTVFDSSYKRGEPATFPLSGVIPGWAEALQLMPVGSKYTFWIPSKLAYGENGAGPIGPNSTLKFEVELMKIEPPKQDDGDKK